MRITTLRILIPAFLNMCTAINLSISTLDYCLLNCNGINHTMCDYSSGGGPTCEDFQGGLTEEEEKMILDLHNQLRQRVATGSESQGEQPPASNMLEIIWDKEAAIIAQRWADQCDLLGHDRCRRTLHELHVGQNIAWMKGVDYPGRTKSREDVIEYFITGWYNEVENFNGDVEFFNPSDQDFPKFGHYTQLVWANTGEIGCGFVQWTTEMEYEYKLVCNYVPGGNVRGKEVYKRGQPCSQCPLFSKCSATWPGLCEADDWSQNGDIKVTNQTFKSEVEDSPKDSVVTENVEEKEKEDESIKEAPVVSVKEETVVINSDKKEGIIQSEENGSKKGNGHALRSFLFVTIFTIFLNCYLFKIAVIS